MKWKPKDGPKLGDYRTVKKFALFPTKLDNGDIVWLEIVYINEYYTDDYMSGPRWIISNYYQLEEDEE
jgi:hypothetical protein